MCYSKIMEKAIDVLYRDVKSDHRTYTNTQQMNHMLWAAVWRSGPSEQKDKLSKHRMETDRKVVKTLEMMMAIEAFNKAVRGMEKQGIDIDTLIEYKKI